MINAFLDEALLLAGEGIGHVSPNPMVGAVIVKNGKIIGRGYHAKAGSPHGEIKALNNCSTSPEGASIYINLEPCSHEGKTPPCVQAIIKSGIKEVIFSTIDPNPQVNGS